jgi:hypothetical protein
MLSEHTVTVEWRKLFQGGNFNADTLRQAERLIERLPFTSPLGVRFTAYLDATVHFTHVAD